jgi:ribosomal-protein-alanine acetyltransferase
VTAVRRDAPVVLRPMQADDVAQVAAIERASFAVPWTEDAFRHELDLPFSRVLVAAITGEPCTVAGFVVRWRVASEVHLLDLAVALGHRRRGVGLTLAAAVVDEARTSGAELITLEVAERNQAARALYGGLGFAPSMVRRDYYGAGEHALVMERRF